MPATETIPAPEGSTPRQRRSVITRTLLRALAIAGALVALYYAAPLDTALDAYAVLLLVLCLAVFAAIVIWRRRQAVIATSI
jgi:hypothetical protein